MPKPISPELINFKAQLDLHRQAHPRRSRIPEQLWQQAVGLLEHHSVSAICRFTHLHPEGLRKRAHSSGSQPQAPRVAQTFLQLDSSALNSPPPKKTLATPNIPASFNNTSAYRLSLERSDGTRLTLHLPSSEWSQIEAFCSLFLRS